MTAEAREKFREWCEVTGLVDLDTGYYFELESWLEDSYQDGKNEALQIAEKAVGEAKLNRLGYPDEMVDRIVKLAVDDMERDILSRIKAEMGGE